MLIYFLHSGTQCWPRPPEPATTPTDTECEHGSPASEYCHTTDAYH